MIDYDGTPTVGQEYTVNGRTWKCIQVVPSIMWDMVPVGTADVEAAGASALAAATQANLSTAQAALAATAKTCAETARDAALATGKLYVTVAAAQADAGLAVNAGYVAPLADGSLQAYRKDSTVASTAIGLPFSTSVAVAANAANIAPVKDVFTYVTSPNLYNPALAENGFIYDFTAGYKTAYANGIASGKVPVTEGKTYTFSQPSTERGFLGNVHCYSGGAGATYLGMASALSGAPVIDRKSTRLNSSHS